MNPPAVRTPRAVSYLRVSTKEQAERDGDPEGYSIPGQREANQRKADSLGATIVAEFVDRGESARSADRPELQRMLTSLKTADVQYVIVHKVDRLARNRADDVAIHLAIQKAGAALVSATENIDETPSGMLVHGIMSSIAEFYSRNLANEVIKGLDQKARGGGTPGRAPVGYLNVRTSNADGREVRSIALDPERAPLVRLAFELYASGEYSIQRLQETLADQGLTSRPSSRWSAKALSVSQLHQLLRNPYYTGLLTYKGEYFAGRHEPLIDQDLFDRAQEVMDARSRRGQRDRVHMHYLKGMLFCDRCHQAGRTCRLVFTETPSRTGDVYGYFKCRGRQEGLCDLPYLPVALVERAVVDHYASLALPESFLDDMTARLQEALADEQQTTSHLHANLQKQLAQLDQQEERLLDLAVDGSLPQSKIRERLYKIEIERKRTREALTGTSEQLAIGAAVLRLGVDLLRDPQALYRQAPDLARRALDQTFYQRFYLDDGGRVASSVMNPPFNELHDAARAEARECVESEVATRPTNKAPSTNAEGLGGTATGLLPPDPQVGVWNRTVLVAGAGFEPATSGL